MIKHYKIFANPSSHNLPSAYQEVEYLQSNGAQWINTGLYPPMYGKVEAKFKFNAITQKATVWGVAMPRCYVGYEESITIGWWGTYWRTGVLPDTSTIYNSLLTMNGNNATVTINGNTSSGSATATTYADTMFLFARNSGGSPSNNSRFNGRIYTFVVTDDTLGQICNVVPCYRKSDSVAGMYDLVSNTFYTNAGSGTFVVGADVSSTILIPTYKRAYILNNTKISTYKSARVLPRLPNEYQEVEYLQSTGTQYIRYIANYGDNSTFYTKAMCLQNNPSAGGYNTLWGVALGYGGSEIYWDANGAITNYNGQNQKVKIDRVVGDAGFNQVLEITYHPYDSKASFSYALFSYENSYRLIGRIYSHKQYESGVLTHDLIPCYRIYDSSAGFYDLLNSGKNLYDGKITNFAYNNTGAIVEDSANRSIVVRVEQGKTYTFSRQSLAGDIFRVFFTAEYPHAGLEATSISSYDVSTYTCTFTVPSGQNYVTIWLDRGRTPMESTQMMIEEGSTASSYERSPFLTNSGTGSFIVGPNTNIIIS